MGKHYSLYAAQYRAALKSVSCVMCHPSVQGRTLPCKMLFILHCIIQSSSFNHHALLCDPALLLPRVCGQIMCGAHYSLHAAQSRAAPLQTLRTESAKAEKIQRDAITCTQRTRAAPLQSVSCAMCHPPIMKALPLPAAGNYCTIMKDKRHQQKQGKISSLSSVFMLLTASCLSHTGPPSGPCCC